MWQLLDVADTLHTINCSKSHMPSRLVVAFCPYPLMADGSTTPVPVSDVQCKKLERRIDQLDPAVMANIRNAMKSVLAKHAKQPVEVLLDALTNLLCHVERDDVQYPVIGDRVFIVSAADGTMPQNLYTVDQVLALDMSGITKEPL